MEEIQRDEIPTHAGSVNRIKLDNMWNQISASMGIEESQLSLEGLQNLFSNKLETNIFSYPALQPEMDCPWSARDLSEELMVELDKMEYDKIVLPNTTCVEDINPEKTYIPYEKLPIKAKKGWKIEEAKAIMHETINGPRKYCFLKTRAIATVVCATQDFFLDIRQKKEEKPQVSQPHCQTNTFTLQKYPLRYPKGREAQELKRIYKNSLGVKSIDEFHSRAAHDFLISIYLWTCLKYNTLKELVVAGSLFCITTYVDFVGEADDSEYGALEVYCRALGEGLSLYTCHSLSRLPEITVLNTAFMTLKSDIRNIIRDSESIVPFTSPPTPLHYMEMKWWDGAMPAYLKVPLGLASVREHVIPLDKYGSPLGTRNCLGIRNSVELVVRYNDAIDIIHDIGSEPLNEIHVALRHGGVLAVCNYGNACAACIGQCGLCKCGDPSHDWAVDVGVGIANWYAFVPRYKAWTQLAEMCHFSAAKYEELIRNSRHGAFVTAQVAVLEEKAKFWNENWEPMVKMYKTPPYVRGECEHCGLIQRWVIGRCLYRDAKSRKISIELIQKHVRDNAHINLSVDMSGFWGKIVEIAVGNIVEYNIVQEYSQMVETVWERLRNVLKVDTNLEVVMKMQVDTWFEIDKLLVKSYNLKFGHVIRRALMGAVSLQIEHTDIAIYQKIGEGIIAFSLHGAN